MQKPAVSRMVIYKTIEGDRPMIITQVWSDSCVNGRVILEPSDIGISAGIKIGTDAHVSSCLRGRDVGTWRFFDDES